MAFIWKETRWARGTGTEILAAILLGDAMCEVKDGGEGVSFTSRSKQPGSLPSSEAFQWRAGRLWNLSLQWCASLEG